MNIVGFIFLFVVLCIVCSGGSCHSMLSGDPTTHPPDIRYAKKYVSDIGKDAEEVLK